MYTVKIATTEEFEKSNTRWNKLASAMPIPSIFCTWEWIYTWWEHFGAQYKPLILFVYKNSELTGILPLASHKTLFNRGGMTGRILTYCGSRELYPDHVDIISSKGDAEKCIQAVLTFLLMDYKDWDVVHLASVRQNSDIEFCLSNGDCHLSYDIQQMSVSPYIPIVGSFDEYNKTLSHNLRKNIKKRKQKLIEISNFRYGTSGRQNPADDLQVLFDLHERRAQRKQIKSSFYKDETMWFHKDLLKRVAKNGWVWIRSIHSNDKVIASSYCFVFGGRVSAYQKGIDPAWEHYGTGTLINYEVIKEAFEKEYKEFDFLRGNEEHKSQWTQKKRVLLNINIYNNTIKATICKNLARLKNRLRNAIMNNGKEFTSSLESE